jgi:3-dehydroquinate dehydratase/shikimate dehydrogenase
MPFRHSKTCISILAKTEEELLDKIMHSRYSDLVEFRLDFLPDFDLKLLRSKTDQEIILTIRTLKEGGFFRGAISKIGMVYQKAIDNKIDYLDIEYSISDDLLPKLSIKSTTKIILSQHTNIKNFEKLQIILNSMLKIKADVYKLIYTAHNLNDSLTVINLIENLKNNGRKFVIHAMGENGKLSRVLGALKGNAWTYLASDIGAETAKGQITVDEAINKYFLHEKSSATRIFGLIGYPIAQSKGWIIHNQLFHQSITRFEAGDSPYLNAIYVNFPVKNLSAFWQLWQSHVNGFSVTIPHKESILKCADELSEEVRLSSVCNTLLKKGNRWIAANTDLLAIFKLLQPYSEQLVHGVLIVGTGATARSTVVALQKLNVEKIYLIGRNTQRGKFLSKLYSTEYFREDEIPYLNLGGIIQTTPIGMYPNEKVRPLGDQYFREGMIVLDVIYNPVKTKFLIAAENRGCTIISGKKMFLLQACEQFKLFSGLSIPEKHLDKIWEEIDQ